MDSAGSQSGRLRIGEQESLCRENLEVEKETLRDLESQVSKIKNADLDASGIRERKAYLLKVNSGNRVYIERLFAPCGDADVDAWGRSKQPGGEVRRSRPPRPHAWLLRESASDGRTGKCTADCRSRPQTSRACSPDSAPGRIPPVGPRT